MGTPVDLSDECFEDASTPPDYQPDTPTNIVDDFTHDGFDGSAIKPETLFTPSKSSLLPLVIPADEPKDFDAQCVIDNAGSTPFSPLQVGPVGPTAVSTAVANHNIYYADAEEIETGATAGFYGGYAVEESPSPYHAPNVDDDAGFGDIRDGCEHVPEQWTHEETQAHVVAPYKLESNSFESKVFELPALKPVKPVLQPKSQIAKAAKTCDMGCGYGHRAFLTSQLTGISDFALKVIEQSKGKCSSPLIVHFLMW